jgi:hypothetical protein
MSTPFNYSLTRRSRVQVPPTPARARHSDTMDRRIVNRHEMIPYFCEMFGPTTRPHLTCQGEIIKSRATPTFWRIRHVRWLNLMDEVFEWHCRETLFDGTRVAIVRLSGHRLTLRPMSKPEGAPPARFEHCRLWACPCHACCGFCSLL